MGGTQSNEVQTGITTPDWPGEAACLDWPRREDCAMAWLVCLPLPSTSKPALHTVSRDNSVVVSLWFQLWCGRSSTGVTVSYTCIAYLPPLRD